MKPQGPLCVDFEDQAYVMAKRWTRSTKGYVVRTNREDGARRQYAKRGAPQRMEYLHRTLFGEPDVQIVDHISGDILDNRKQNLRGCLAFQNARNQRVAVDNSLGTKGVTFRPDRKRNKFQARICVRGVTIGLGHHPTLDAARAAYDTAAKQYHGEFARLNQGEML